MNEGNKPHHSSKWLSPFSSKGKEKSTKISQSPSHSKSHSSKDGLTTKEADTRHNSRGTLDSTKKAAEEHRPVKPAYNETLAISATNYQCMHEMIEEVCSRPSLNFGGIDSQPFQVGRYYPNQTYSITAIGPPRKEYILRIPSNARYFDAVNEKLMTEEKLLRFLKDKLPVPEVVGIDYSGSNALWASFMIQSRIPGVPLNTVYGNMSLKEKRNIAIQVADLITKIEGIQFPDAGELDTDNPDKYGTPGIRLFQTDYEWPCHSKNKQRETGSDLQALMLSLLQGWKEYTQIKIQRHTPKVEYPEELASQLLIYQRLEEMIKDMGQRGYFLDPGSPSVLHYWDLRPGNIIVRKSCSSNKWRITGLIDWDDIDALPRILTRNPPTWLWESPNPVSETPFQELRRRKLPQPPPYPGIPSSELSSVKKTFDAKIEKLMRGYCRDAYGNAGYWLRKLWPFIKNRCSSFEEMESRCEDLIEEWEEYVWAREGVKKTWIRRVRAPQNFEESLQQQYAKSMEKEGKSAG